MLDINRLEYLLIRNQSGEKKVSVAGRIVNDNSWTYVDVVRV